MAHQLVACRLQCRSASGGGQAQNRRCVERDGKWRKRGRSGDDVFGWSLSWGEGRQTRSVAEQFRRGQTRSWGRTTSIIVRKCAISLSDRGGREGGKTYLKCVTFRKNCQLMRCSLNFVGCETTGDGVFAWSAYHAMFSRFELHSSLQPLQNLFSCHSLLSRRSHLGPLNLEKKLTSRRFIRIGPRTSTFTCR